MKSIDKYVTALKNPAEEAAKRYKALTSLKKTCKEHEDMPTYIQVINEYHNNIFFSITEKMAKFSIKIVISNAFLGCLLQLSKKS